MKPMVLSILLAGLVTSCSPPEKAAAPEAGERKATTEVAHVDAAGAAKLLAGSPKPVVLDVRTPEEYAEGHIAGATNVDFKAADFAAKAGQLDKATPYIVHCRSGRRSTASLEVLRELGFQKIYHLDGGMNAWSEAGQPVEK